MTIFDEENDTENGTLVKTARFKVSNSVCTRTRADPGIG